MEDEDYKYVGSFPMAYGQMLLEQLDGVTDKKQRKEITDAFIADFRYAFFSPSEMQALNDGRENP